MAPKDRLDSYITMLVNRGRCSSDDHRRLRSMVVAVVLLLILFGQETIGSTRLSLTVDEPIHIALGYTGLVLGDYEHMPLHEPPLINQWSAWPLLFRSDRPDPRELSSWGSRYPPRFGADLLKQLGPIRATEFAARVPVMLLSLALGAVVFRWASDLFGARAGIVALFLLACDPNIIAQAQLSTTDVGGLTFGVLALFAAWRSVRRPALGHILLTGVALGLAVAAKVSGSYYALMIGLLVGLSVVVGQNKARRRWVVRLLAMYGVAFLVFWASYRFQVGDLTGLSFPVPAAAHFRVLSAFRDHVAAGHRAFAAGQVGQQGWWWYFPFALAIKTPLPTLLLIIPAVMAGIRSRPDSWLDDVWLLAIPLAYLASSMTSTINIGYRHLLPLLPFLFVYISRLANWRPRLRAEWITSWTVPAVLTGCMLWCLVGTLNSFPNYLAYFNELVGGPENGHRYLADSNTDWGQALKDLASYQRNEGIKEVQLATFSHLDPAVYGVSYRPLPPLGGSEFPVFVPSFSPPPGDYVISATILQGISIAYPEMYDWFRHRRPDATIGAVMFLYHVEREHPARTWVAQCAQDAAPLDAHNLAKGFGRSDLRLLTIDCSQSLVIPSDGASPGWLVLAGEPPDWLAPHLATLRLSYQETYAGPSSPLRIYEVDDAYGFISSDRIRLNDAEAGMEEAASAYRP